MFELLGSVKGGDLLNKMIICGQNHCSLLSHIVYEQPWAYTLLYFATKNYVLFFDVILTVHLR